MSGLRQLQETKAVECEEVRKEKKRLEAVIFALLNTKCQEFKEATGVSITDIEVGFTPIYPRWPMPIEATEGEPYYILGSVRVRLEDI